jgi:hypothetical protein
MFFYCKQMFSRKDGYNLSISNVTPYVIFAQTQSTTIPDHTVIVIAIDTSYGFGILQSRYHELWAWARCSTFEERLRYTLSSIFKSFPFPLLPNGDYDPRIVPDSEAATRVASSAEALYTRRAELCRDRQQGLTKLYNAMKAGELPELQALHDAVNDAVTACYGWPEGLWRDDNAVLRHLLALNYELAGRGADGQRVLE